MNEETETGEEVLSLSLGLNSSCCANATKMKRKERATMQDVEDSKLFKPLQMRDQMLIHDPKRKGGLEGTTTNGLQLIHWLLFAATAIDENNTSSAVDALHEIYKNASFRGDSIQRVAVYFADALSARLPSPRSPFHHYYSILVSPTPEEEFTAFTEFYQASPYYQFAHFTANQAIVEAFENEEKRNGGRIHVIDFDVSHGFQWPSLIQSLSDKATTSSKRISLRITGFSRSIEELEETEARLVNFASGCDNLSFEFEGILRGTSPCDNIRIEKYSTLVVNLVFYLQTLSSSKEMHDTLATIHSLNPSLVVLIEREGNQSPRSFLTRFMESLHYYAAMFDSLNECLPPDSVERLNIEKNHLGREIKCAMNQEDREGHFEVESLKHRMERVGFEEMRLSSRTVSQAKLLLKIKSHGSVIGYGCNYGGFRVLVRDEGREISLGWQERLLITASGWSCRE